VILTISQLTSRSGWGTPKKIISFTGVRHMLVRALFIAGVVAGVAIGAAPAATAAPYENCKAAAEDNRYSIPSDDPAYGDWLDSDGIGCEKN
jgi:hypothetical protein